MDPSNSLQLHTWTKKVVIIALHKLIPGYQVYSRSYFIGSMSIFYCHSVLLKSDQKLIYSNEDKIPIYMLVNYTLALFTNAVELQCCCIIYHLILYEKIAFEVNLT